MSDPFDIYDVAIKEGKTARHAIEMACAHKNVVTSNQCTVCTDCSEVLCDISKRRERVGVYTATSRNQSRHHYRRTHEKNIYNDVEGMDIPAPIIFMANEIYQVVTDGKTRRATIRKSIIFDCVFRAYKYSGVPKSVDQLRAVFPLTQKAISSGMKVVGLNIHKYKKIEPMYINARTLIPELMGKFNAKPKHVQNVVKLYSIIENKSAIINRSRPQSVAISLIYYYIKKTNRDISMLDYTKKVNLSEPTISKLIKEIVKILE